MLPLFPDARTNLLRSTIASWVPHGSDVAIVDVPVHRNIGDLFIYTCTHWLLRDLGCSVVYRAGLRDYRSSTARRRITRDTIIVGLGGGNFGDLYPRYQALRERIVADFPRQRIVVFPQSVHFGRDDVRAASEVALKRHRNLYLAARDARSLVVARQMTSHVAMLPDVVDAVGTGALKEFGSSAPEQENRAQPLGGAGTLYLLRQDVERAPNDRRWPERTDAHDWSSFLRGVSVPVAGAAATMPIAPRPISAWLHERWLRYATTLFTRAAHHMRQFDSVVTDRLHGAILARLAGRPVTLIDNSYGKLAAYYDAWWIGEHGIEIERSSVR